MAGVGIWLCEEMMHAKERSHSVYNFSRDQCGAVHIAAWCRREAVTLKLRGNPKTPKSLVLTTWTQKIGKTMARHFFSRAQQTICCILLWPI